jgi:hypothetical protein
MSSFRCSWALTVSLAVLLPAASLLRSGEEEPGLVGYWGFETGSGVGVSDGQPAWGISPLDASLPQPLAHWNFDTIEGEAVADGQGAVGVVDDTAGHADGPFHGFAVDPASLNEGLNYSADVPAALALSASSLEIDEASGVVEFFSIPANDAFANITTGDFTLHAWFQSTDGGRGVILGAYPEGANARMSLELHTGNRLRFWVNGPDGTADLNVTLADPSRDGLWHVATAVRRGDMHELWFDGVMVGSRENNAGNFVQSAPTMYFGRDGRVGATRFGGKLDDIAMWGEALTVPQIEVLAAGGSPLAGADSRCRSSASSSRPQKASRLATATSPSDRSTRLPATSTDRTTGRESAPSAANCRLTRSPSRRVPRARGRPRSSSRRSAGSRTSASR